MRHGRDGWPPSVRRNDRQAASERRSPPSALGRAVRSTCRRRRSVAVPGGPPPVRRPTSVAAAGRRRRRLAQSNQPPANWGRYVPNEVVVEVAANVSPQTIDGADAAASPHAARDRSICNSAARRSAACGSTTAARFRPWCARWRPTACDGGAAELIATLQETRRQRRRRRCRTSSNMRWRACGCRRRITLATGNRVLIAVIDSGVDTQHPELAGLILDTFDAIGSGDRIHPHGTSIVGAIAARARLRGTAPAPTSSSRARSAPSATAWTARPPTSSRRSTGRCSAARASSI